MWLALKFTSPFSFNISTNKNNLFIWKSLPKIAAVERLEATVTYLEREGCTPEYSLSPFLDPGHLLFSYVFEDNQQLREKMFVGAEV